MKLVVYDRTAENYTISCVCAVAKPSTRSDRNYR